MTFGPRLKGPRATASGAPDALIPVALVVLLMLFVQDRPAAAWSIASSQSTPCHEEIARAAFLYLTSEIEGVGVNPPDDRVYQALENEVLKFMDIPAESLSGPSRFALVSLIVGVRQPDNDGHALMNLDSVRRVHGDKSAEGQYIHALRALDDDGPEGNARAVEGAREIIRTRVIEAMAFSRLPGEEQTERTKVFVEFYGRVEIPVWAAVHRMGIVAHTVADTFSHTLRDEASGLKRIVSVMNYAEAIGGNLDVDRDGLPHSETFDDCTRDDTQPLVAAAAQATLELCKAYRQSVNGQDMQPVEEFLDEWVTLEPGCDESNAYCGNAHWLEIASIEVTGPYLGCAYAPAAAPGPKSGAVAVLALSLVGLLVGRQGRRVGRRLT